MTNLQCCPFCSIVRGEDAVVREVARNDKVVVFSQQSLLSSVTVW